MDPSVATVPDANHSTVENRNQQDGNIKNIEAKIDTNKPMGVAEHQDAQKLGHHATAPGTGGHPKPSVKAVKPNNATPHKSHAEHGSTFKEKAPSKNHE